MSMDPDIKHFLEMPLGGINQGSRLSKPWLPMGKLPTPRAKKDDINGIDENFAPKVSRADLKKLAEKKTPRSASRHAGLLRHYHSAIRAHRNAYRPDAGRSDRRHDQARSVGMITLFHTWLANRAARGWAV